MSLTVEQYLALSALSYEDINLSEYDPDANKLSNLINPSSKLELRPLSSLSNWILINAYTSPSGMSAIALQNPETKEIVFAYRGTDGIESNPIAALKDYKTDIAIATSNTVLKEGLNQFVDAQLFYHNTLQKLGTDNIGEKSFTGHSLGGGLAQYMRNSTNKKEYAHV